MGKGIVVKTEKPASANIMEELICCCDGTQRAKTSQYELGLAPMEAGNLMPMDVVLCPYLLLVRLENKLP